MMRNENLLLDVRPATALALNAACSNSIHWSAERYFRMVKIQNTYSSDAHYEHKFSPLYRKEIASADCKGFLEIREYQIKRN